MNFYAIRQRCEHGILRLTWQRQIAGGGFAVTGELAEKSLGALLTESEVTSRKLEGFEISCRTTLLPLQRRARRKAGSGSGDAHGNR